MSTQDWETRAREKCEAILAAIPSEWRIENPPSREEQPDVTGSFLHQYLNAREIEITEMSAEEILKRTTTGAWKAEEVTRAFCHRAALAHQFVRFFDQNHMCIRITDMLNIYPYQSIPLTQPQTNCLHELFIPAAIASARALDTHFSTHNTPLGPLHGLPISLKDQFHIRNVETTMGYVGWLGTFEGDPTNPKYKTFESEMVTALRSLGAVLYVKTAVPHTLMTGETVNNIIGYVWNPKNRALSAGGSSGGEGALIGCRGSVVGLGTDIGGSIRIPAAFNGLFGLRPSTGRLPYEGMANSMDGQGSVLSVVGPLGTTVEGVRVVTRALLGSGPWGYDPLVHEIPWREGKEREVEERIGGEGKGKGGKLVFGVMRTDGIVRPLPPVSRALEIVVKALRERGHEVVDWVPPNQKVLLYEGFKSCIYDAGEDVKGAFALSGEPVSDQVSSYFQLEKHFNAAEIAATNVRLRQLRKEYLEFWNSTAKLTKGGSVVDAVICPVAPFPAARPGMYEYYGYSTWVNIVDWTAVAFPVTEVDKEVDGKRTGLEEGWEPADETEQKVWESCKIPRERILRALADQKRQMIRISTMEHTLACR